jgi:hypothetical protein
MACSQNFLRENLSMACGQTVHGVEATPNM